MGKTRHPSITDEEQAAAELSWRFEESAEVQELQEQLRHGLVTSVEFAHKILCEWERWVRDWGNKS